MHNCKSKCKLAQAFDQVLDEEVEGGDQQLNVTVGLLEQAGNDASQACSSGRYARSAGSFRWNGLPEARVKLHIYNAFYKGISSWSVLILCARLHSMFILALLICAVY
jgi:hypothetical protein